MVGIVVISLIYKQQIEWINVFILGSKGIMQVFDMGAFVFKLVKTACARRKKKRVDYQWLLL